MKLISNRKLAIRALSLLLLFTILLCSISSAFALIKDETVCSTAIINVRFGPGTNYSIVGKLKANELVKYLSLSGKWAKIEYNGTVAYVYAKYLKSEGVSTTDDSGELYATTSVNVRSGPGTSYSKIGTLAKDQQVTKVGSSGKWIKIVYGSGYAYVYGKYLTGTEPKFDAEPSSNSTLLDSLSFEEQVLALVNRERAAKGLLPLALSRSLSVIAQAKSQDMHDNRYFSHTSPAYGSAFDMLKAANISYRTAGENLAKGYATPEDVVAAWMDSTGHRANILNGSYAQLGVGYVADGCYWTQVFVG